MDGAAARAGLTGPLSRGESARYAAYDWTLRRFGTARPLGPAPVMLVEGVGAGRAAVRPDLVRLLLDGSGRAGSRGRGGGGRDGPAAGGVLGRLDGGGDPPFHRGPFAAVRGSAGTAVPGGVRVASGAFCDSSAGPFRHAPRLPAPALGNGLKTSPASASTPLDPGGVQVLRSQCAAFRSRRRREAPGCSPVIGGFVLPPSPRSGRQVMRFAHPRSPPLPGLRHP